jgi:hypothetical protein
MAALIACTALTLASPTVDRASTLRPHSDDAVADTVDKVATKDKNIKLAVLATAALNEEPTHWDNVKKLAEPVEGTSVVLYAINAIDNKETPWHGWKQKTENLGIAAMVESSHRNLERGFTSKLISQLPLLDRISGSTSFHYVWTIDGDISLRNADLEGLFNSLRSFRPLIAQPTILANAAPEFSWGSQFFKPLSDNYALECPDQSNAAQAYDSPMIESQASILSKTFLDWYRDELEQVVRLQHDYQCDWGHAEMWCSGAARLSKELPDSRPACLRIGHSVDHMNSHGINKWKPFSDGSNYYDQCKQLEDAVERDKKSHSADPGWNLKVYRPPPHADVMVPIPNCTACGRNWCGGNDVCTSFGLDDGKYVRGPDLDVIGCGALVASKTSYCLDGGQKRFAVYRGPAGKSAHVRSNLMGKSTGLSSAALQDHTPITCLNQWADSADSDCSPPTTKNAAIESYRAFVQAGCKGATFRRHDGGLCRSRRGARCKGRRDLPEARNVVRTRWRYERAQGVRRVAGTLLP